MPSETTESGKSAMQVLAAFRWSGAVAWLTCDIYEIFVGIELVSAPRWRGFPRKSWFVGAVASSSRVSHLARSFPPLYRALMDKKDNIRYVPSLFSAICGPLIANSVLPVSALSELRLFGRRHAPRLTTAIPPTKQEHVRHCAR